MATTATTHRQTTSTQQGVLHGILGGLAGGVVFGVMMQALGMMGMIAMLVGSESIAVAWVVHLAISAVFGAVYGAVVAPRVTGWGAGLGTGVAYGALLWVIGPLLLMPARMGMPVFTIDTMALQSLLGHLVFGLVLGAVVVALSRRERS
jgi:uncharacterized membrane protein YagU involved in acid resistance